jgi:hypothetical protein
MNGTLVKSIDKKRNRKTKKGLLHKLKMYFMFNPLKAKTTDPYIVDTNNEDIVKMRKKEITMFSKQLYDFGFDFTSLTSQKPRKEQEIKQAYFVAQTISTNEEISKKMFGKKALPLLDISDLLSIKKNFLVENEAYILGLSLLLIGDYKLLKEYLVEEKT